MTDNTTDDTIKMLIIPTDVVSSSHSENPSENSIEERNSNSKISKVICPTEDEWTKEIEELIKRWKDQIEKLSHVHQESGYINRTRYYRYALPSIILPFIMTLVSQNLYNGTNDVSHIIDGVAFMFTSILSALGLFFNYNQLSESHFQTSSRYTDISNRIDSELARKSKFRTPSDVFITELKCKIESLGEGAPTLPGQWC